MFGFWLAVVEGTLLGFDAQRVIALQAMKIAAGGSSARSEVSRMVTEKVSAGTEAAAILTRGGRAGGSNVLFKPSPEFRLDLFHAGCFFPR